MVINTTVISFNKTSFNLSNYTTKTTTFPKIQEINTKILISCVFLLNNINIIKIDNKSF